ncbi:MAG: hypothetical protein JSV80_06525, partial [Acidobacteriota bacterium]
MRTRLLLLCLLFALGGAAGCSDGTQTGEATERQSPAHPARGGQSASPWASSGDGQSPAAVPVEVASVQRRSISSYIETNGTLEAEYEVDIVARVAAPIVELRAEEAMAVDEGQLVARLDDTEYRARLEISRVRVNETKLAYDRARELQQQQLISNEAHDQAKADYESATAQFESDEIELGYTEIRAPFAGLIVRRYV